MKYGFTKSHQVIINFLLSHPEGLKSGYELKRESNSVLRALKDLEKKGVITQEEGVYNFSKEFFSANNLDIDKERAKFKELLSQNDRLATEIKEHPDKKILKTSTIEDLKKFFKRVE